MIRLDGAIRHSCGSVTCRARSRSHHPATGSMSRGATYPDSLSSIATRKKSSTAWHCRVPSPRSGSIRSPAGRFAGRLLAAAAPRRRVSVRARPLPDAGAGRSHGTTSGPTLLDLSARTVTSVRQLPLSRLGHLVPPLLDNAALVALVAVTNDPPWAAKAAWDIARIAARDGRRVALVDLCLENPALHEMVGLHATEGIVDAFEYGVSLNKAAHEVTGVFIIPAGSETAHPAEVYAHPRWPKLQAGVRSHRAW